MHLSYAKLNTYRQCPLRYRLTYHDRLPRRPRRLFRAARRLHHALMVWLTYARDGAPSLAEALRAYDHAWNAAKAASMAARAPKGQKRRPHEPTIPKRARVRKFGRLDRSLRSLRCRPE